jgi:hypothetical protein
MLSAATAGAAKTKIMITAYRKAAYHSRGFNHYRIISRLMEKGVALGHR